CVSDFAVSSYSPNIGKLLDARERFKTATVADAKVLFVTAPETPGYADLPNTLTEVQEIRQLLPIAVDIQHNGAHATVAETLGCCQRASILHLACHGQQDVGDALESGFVLEDGKLTISALMRLDLPDAFFAFLSACESAKGDAEQPDELVSLSAAMMFAGFKSVIGTMWSMNDTDGPLIAKCVYHALFDGATNLDPSAIPYALDAATTELRRSGLSPTRWATYIHMGI
ncbi:hypothetical protein PUNSTDRAFT_66413, partial [Punctularia strigosozonata HHB-11173 SS5]|uniref:uncharacterized protein n=1 Tax=Punctularia strigosozonata (strain HHB-11173) TaxID=741275 RepID=UPI000441705B